MEAKIAVKKKNISIVIFINRWENWDSYEIVEEIAIKIVKFIIFK